MLITRVSRLTGESHTKEIPVTLEQIDKYYQYGLLVQQAFPNLSSDDREFLLTGIIPEEWNNAFKEEGE